jgi:hypothetical protein
VPVCIRLYGLYGSFPRLSELGASELYAASLGPCQRVPRLRCNHRSLLLCKRGEQMQDEGVHIRAKLGDNEWHPLCHQAGDEMNVAAQTVELGDGNGATTAASLRERGGKLWSAVKRVRALASLYFGELSDNFEPLSHNKPRKRLRLRF